MRGGGSEYFERDFNDFEEDFDDDDGFHLPDVKSLPAWGSEFPR